MASLPSRFEKPARQALVLLSLSLMLIGLGCLAGCNKKRQAENVKVEHGYLGQERHNKDIAVVFVHGVFGTAADTWVSQRVTFPSLLAGDPEFKPLVDVFVFEYSSPYLKYAPSIVGVASQLHSALAPVFDTHREVIFLAHSMGGLVVRELLNENRDLLRKVPMVYFYATPGNGADISSLASKISNNPQLRGMIALEGSDYLQSSQNTWRASVAQQQTDVYCGYETAPTDGILIVPQGSASALCSRPVTALPGNHVDVVKPPNREDFRYSAFATAIRTSAILKLPNQAEITFHTTDHGKSDLTALEIQLLRGNTVLSTRDNIAGMFRRDQTTKIEMPATFSSADLDSMSIRVVIIPARKGGEKDNDKWTFEPSALFISSDGKAYVREWDEKKLTSKKPIAVFGTTSEHGHHADQ